jgi:hypothetical protein
MTSFFRGMRVAALSLLRASKSRQTIKKWETMPSRAYASLGMICMVGEGDGSR